MKKGGGIYTAKKLISPLLVLLFLISGMSGMAQSSCSNSDFSMGDFTNWTGYTSIYPDTVPGTSAGTSGIPYYYTQGIVPGRHTIITAAVPDPFTNNNVLTLPPGEKFAARLGNGGFGVWGDGVQYQRDFLEYTIGVTPASNLLTYKYAVVLQDPNNDPNVAPHPVPLRPRFKMTITDANGLIVDPQCGQYNIFVDSTIDGFRECTNAEYTALGAQALNGGSVMYRAWSTVSVDLRKYINSNVTVKFETWDCGYGGHFGYAYLMMRCDSLGLTAQGCHSNGNVTVKAPDGFAYDWQPNHETTQEAEYSGLKDGDTVSVILTSTMGCQTEVKTVVHPTATKAIFSANPLKICVNDSIQFTDASHSEYTGGGAPLPLTSRNWSFGDGATSQQLNPAHQFTTPGTYTVTLTVANSQGCADSTVQVVQVMPPPVADFAAPNACIGDPVTFVDLSNTNSGNITTWNWNLGGSISNIQTPLNQIYTTAGPVLITLQIATDLGCKHDTSHTITIWPLPQAVFTANNVCQGDTTFFNDQSVSTLLSDPLVSWKWNFGDAYPGVMGQNQWHIYQNSGTYTATLQVTTNNGCTAKTQNNIVVNPPPHADFSALPVCLDKPVQFTDLSTSQTGAAINSWKWDFGDLSPNDLSKDPAHQYAQDGFYSITLWIENTFGCKDSIIKPIQLKPLPQIGFDANLYEGCAPLCVNFSDLSLSLSDPIKYWDWDFGDGNSSAIDNSFNCFKKPGDYSVSLDITTTEGCKQSFTWTDMIHVYPFPVSAFDFTPGEASEDSPVITFTDASSGAVAWEWTFGDNGFANDRNPDHTYSGAGTYTIWQYVESTHGCRDSTQKEIKIIPEWSLYIPNTFTPNGDGKNDDFIAKGHNISNFEMWIYDRWGNEIYYCKDFNAPWNGKVQEGNSNKVAQVDTYIWIIKYNDIRNVNHRQTGHVNLVR